MGLIAAAHYLAPLIFIYGAIFKGSGDPLHQVAEFLDGCHALSLDRMPGMHHIGHRNKKSSHRLRQQVQRRMAVCDLHQRQQQVRIQFVITAPPSCAMNVPYSIPRMWATAFGGTPLRASLTTCRTRPVTLGYLVMMLHFPREWRDSLLHPC